jgi:hypothetical protein
MTLVLPRSRLPRILIWFRGMISCPLQEVETAHSSTPPTNSSLAHIRTASPLLLEPIRNRNDGVRAPRKASQPQELQILRRRPLSPIALRAEALLHAFRDKMLPHVHGAEPDHLDGVQFRGG